MAAVLTREGTHQEKKKGKMACDDKGSDCRNTAVIQEMPRTEGHQWKLG